MSNHNIECSICFGYDYSDNPNSPKRIYSTQCNHHFHFECLQKWCITNNSCPTCRTIDIMDISNKTNPNNPYRIRRENRNDYPAMNNYHYSNNNVISQESNHTTYTDISNNYGDTSNIDNILDRMRNDYIHTGVVSSYNLQAYYSALGYSPDAVNMLITRNNSNNNPNRSNLINTIYNENQLNIPDTPLPRRAAYFI
tara:strand:- start:291 stop:881 length:591 start_codon:yes stop_codon:yes gene_type:complete